MRDNEELDLDDGLLLRDRIMELTEADFLKAAKRIAPHAIATPLLDAPAAGGARVKVKCENLQTGGSFKIRCAANVIEQLPPELIRRGVVTASAGNFAPSLAIAGARHSMPLTCHLPNQSAAVKVARLRDLGVELVFHDFEHWWRIMETREAGSPDRTFLHPVCEAEGVAGNGTIALELLEQWAEIDTVVVPFGGGGLISGIAAAMRAARPGVRIYASEIEGAAPLAAAFAAGAPVAVDRQPNFASGAGRQSVLPVMWPLLRELVDGVITVSNEEALAAFRSLAFDSHLVVEAQSAIPYAAAQSPRLAGRNVAAILSGGNIDPAVLRANLVS